MRRNGGRVRLDKFMKVSRLAKRRSEAHEALEHGRITKDGKPLKPGYQVKPGDVLEIHYATQVRHRSRARGAVARDARASSPPSSTRSSTRAKTSADWL